MMTMTMTVTMTMTHYYDVIMSAIASKITSQMIVYSTVYSDADQSKHQSSASLAFVRKIHRGPVNFPHKWPVTRKMFPFDDVIMDDYEIILNGRDTIFLMNVNDKYRTILGCQISSRLELIILLRMMIMVITIKQ